MHGVHRQTLEDMREFVRYTMEDTPLAERSIVEKVAFWHDGVRVRDELHAYLARREMDRTLTLERADELWSLWQKALKDLGRNVNPLDVK